MNVTAILDFIMNAIIVVMAVLAGIIGLLIWKMTVIYEWHLQNKKAKEQDEGNDTE